MLDLYRIGVVILTSLYDSDSSMPHFRKQVRPPQFEPVPIGVILALTLSLARSRPKAVFTSSNGKPLVKTCPMLTVPASSELRADTSCAFPQPVIGVWLANGNIACMSYTDHYDRVLEAPITSFRGLLTVVHHHMHRSLGKYSRFTRHQNFLHKPSPVLFQHVGCSISLSCNDIIAGPGMVAAASSMGPG